MGVFSPPPPPKGGIAFDLKPPQHGSPRKKTPDTYLDTLPHWQCCIAGAGVHETFRLPARALCGYRGGARREPGSAWDRCASHDQSLGTSAWRGVGGSAGWLVTTGPASSCLVVCGR